MTEHEIAQTQTVEIKRLLNQTDYFAQTIIFSIYNLKWTKHGKQHINVVCRGESVWWPIFQNTVSMCNILFLHFRICVGCSCILLHGCINTIVRANCSSPNYQCIVIIFHLTNWVAFTRKYKHSCVLLDFHTWLCMLTLKYTKN